MAADALRIYADAIASRPDAQIIYADDDILSEGGRRMQPHFKPQWNPELFEHHDYLSGACMVRVGPGDLSADVDEDWPGALIRRKVASGVSPVHVPFVLHHRRRRPAPALPGKPPLLAGEAMPQVSIIVPTRNQLALLRSCIEGVWATNYPSRDLLVVDNGSDDPETLAFLDGLRGDGTKVLSVPGPFNYSALNNEAVRHAVGDILLFLNNDVEMIDDDWLSLLVMHAAKPDVGAVGAQLLYPDGTVQHAGVYTGIGGGAAHAHRFLAADEQGYFERARLPQRVSAVTAACLAVGRDKFLRVGGFDEQEFPVAFNDVDLCLKLGAAGWHTIYEPRAKLIHHESKSRGNDRERVNRARFAGELAALKRKWRTDVERDPFHHPQLSPFSEQFFVAI
ncbi:MAG TPA: glycosyltransferase family 2 protein [Sphingomicrobium sp.]